MEQMEKTLHTHMFFRHFYYIFLYSILWLIVFTNSLLKLVLNFQVVLTVDGHGSSLSVDDGKACKRFNIILLMLYPNATFLMQLADVAVFKSFKMLWKEAVLNFRGNEFDKILFKSHFAAAFKSAFHQINKSTIINGFRACIRGIQMQMIIQNI